jgi:hypothetical protein
MLRFNLAAFSSDSLPLVSGQIVIASSTQSFSGATAHIFLQDVSFSDKVAILLGKSVISNVSHDANAGKNTIVPFVIYAGENVKISPRNDYAVRVWLDLDSDGKENPKDLYSDQRYPVLTRGFGNTVTIEIGNR